ncbi:polysaccharide lyase [Dickeya solani]|uniref:Pectate lyase D n=1 Tax=Dickeya solani D s0432-1 TaxID=1231725 RepID=A0AAV3K6N0_9GAMM|nr:polysaccharide lyase [Dickeya solani]ANE74435.1 pectate lyase [Dickeya solani IPO 2222]AUC41683.1 Pectate lyase precursor [Dickeya solani RNS 08.23.3.1.A]AUH10149.1 pectate lyase [Dickeya solani D s0432-1]AUH14097.1 pectate lyase [Dickeya solani]AYQ48910.1 Pectate lyase E precursor [Dickeya solani]
MNNTRVSSAGTKSLLAAIIATAMMTSAAHAASLQTTKATEAASTGWATQSNGTTGGAKATSAKIYAVKNISEFKAALNGTDTDPKIIQITGAIDISGGKAYTSFDDQKARSQLSIPSNTTIIGIGSNGKFTNGSLVIKGVSNVILRNLYIETPVDVAPHYESGDGWNAEWDAAVIDSSTNVWVDHVTISDGSFTDDKYTTKDGEKYVQHDGALDIKKGSDYVTISYSRFELHDKTILIGHSDSNGSQDSGKLRVTFHNNVFDRVTERTPRVRFGSIHAYNNVYLGDVKHSVYPYAYSFGLGTSGSILSEANSFTLSNLKSIDGKNPECSIVKQFNSKVFSDKGSLVNGSSTTNLDTCGLTAYKPTLPYKYSAQTMTSSLASSINSNAGYGKL